MATLHVTPNDSKSSNSSLAPFTDTQARIMALLLDAWGLAKTLPHGVQDNVVLCIDMTATDCRQWMTEANGASRGL